MKHDPRHIILIPLLAIIMAACSDTPLPAPAPAPGKQMRPLSFTMPSATLLPATASRADETEEIMLWEGEQIFPGKLDYTSIPETGKFVTDRPAIGGTITVEVKNLTEVLTSDETVTETAPRVYFIIGSSWYDNGVDNGYTPNRTEGEISYYQFTITKDIALKMQTGGLRIMGAGCTATKVTYTAVKPGGLTYDGVHTQFTTGTLIGCVIAYKNAEAEGGYEYKANSCWAWHPEGLRLTKLFNADNAAIEINSDANDILRHYTTEELAAAAVDDPEIATDPRSPYFLRLLDPTAEYAFFFYYPYVDEEILTAEIAPNLNSTVKKKWENGVEIEYTEYTYNLSRINCANSEESNTTPSEQVIDLSNLTGELLNKKLFKYTISKNGNEGTASTIVTMPWTEYPVGAMINYSQGNPTERLNNSDFMYVSVKETPKGDPVTKDNAKNEISVVMQKKMVTMDLYVLTDVDETSLKLIPGPANSVPSMKRLKRFNLLTGEFGEDFYYQDPWHGTDIEKNSRYATDVIPCKIGTATETINGVATNYNVFRVIMPPQSASEFRCSLSFKVKESDKTLTLNEMHQNSGIKSLQSGYHYKLRFTKLNEQFGFHLDIVNWEKGDEISINRPD